MSNEENDRTPLISGSHTQIFLTHEQSSDPSVGFVIIPANCSQCHNDPELPRALLRLRQVIERTEPTPTLLRDVQTVLEALKRHHED